MTARRLAVLTMAGVLLIGGLVVGIRLLTASARTAAAGPTCTERTVAAGQKLTSNLVTVNVFNASRRAGLANRVTINLQRKGFLGGQISNNTSAAKPRTVAILANDRHDPMVELVAAQFADDVTYAKPDVKVDAGVIVVVGDDYTRLDKKAPSRVKANRAVTTCVPVVQLP